jgi:hypothetical protein
VTIWIKKKLACLRRKKTTKITAAPDLHDSSAPLFIRSQPCYRSRLQYNQSGCINKNTKHQQHTLFPFLFLVSAHAHPTCLTGTIGHVAHGKSTVVKAISGVQVLAPFLDFDDISSQSHTFLPRFIFFSAFRSNLTLIQILE